MAKIELDKYYTSIEVAKRLINKTYEIIEKENISEIIEPSAGDGAFSLQIENCIAYDIEPHHESIKRQDFLTLELDYKKDRLFIGNPPFGVRNTLSVKFFKKCIKLGDYVAFILPISQLNNNMQMYEFDLIHSEDLGRINYSGVEVHCCFNIYKRPSSGICNKKPNYDLQDVKVFDYRRSRYTVEKIPNNYDIAICSYGDIGKIIDYEGQYVNEFYFYISNQSLKDEIISTILSADWKEIYKMTTSPNLSQWQINKYLKEKIPSIK